MEVNVISRETIKPSSPTPSHLRTIKTSLADKINLKINFDFLYFYKISKEDGGVVNKEHLKHSLSEALTRFYPLAGRIGDDEIIDCNDKGVLFCTSLVNCTMAELLACPNSESFSHLALPRPPICPTESDSIDDDGPAQIAFQLNEFSCGGVALYVCFSHKIIDMITIVAFLKCWAAIANGSQVNEDMYFNYHLGKSLFPVDKEGESLPTELLVPVERTLLNDGKGIVKRFVFASGAIDTLKTKATSEVVSRPTRVEALTAFIWKRCMAASTVVWGSQKPSMVCHAVDLRRRMVPPLSEYSGGNLISKTLAYCDAASATNIGEDGLVGILRKDLKKIKDGMVLKLQNGNAFGAVLEHLEEVRDKCSDKNLNSYIFSSWCRMGQNEVDFGWGKPIWASQMGGDEVHPMFKNIIVFMDGETRCDNVDVWVALHKREMEVLENDSEFLAFATPNPPVLP